jgi:hypothetical protein
MTSHQIGDAHLLSLALRHGGCLATFNREIPNLAPGISAKIIHLIPSNIS